MGSKYSVEVKANIIFNFKNIIATDSKQAITIAKNEIANKLCPNDILDKTEMGIIDCNFKRESDVILLKGVLRDDALVDKINKIYNNPIQRGNFILILKTLIDRDQEDINNIFSTTTFRIKDDMNENMILSYIHDYLTHVADDNDLETIIKFCS